MIINDLPTIGGEYTFTILHTNGSNGSEGGSDSYTTTEAHEYIAVVANGWQNQQNSPVTTCSSGTLVYGGYDNTTNQRLSVRIWKGVGSGSTIGIPSTSGRWSWQIIGIDQ